VAIRRGTVGGLIAFGGGALMGFLAVAGHHMFILLHDFGNPTFPYLNQVFHRVLGNLKRFGDARFLPQDFGS